MATILKILAVLPFILIGTCSKDIIVDNVCFNAQGGQAVVIPSMPVLAFSSKVDTFHSVHEKLNDIGDAVIFEHEWLTVQSAAEYEWQELHVTALPNDTGAERSMLINISNGSSRGFFVVYQSAD